jgi:hypothetical protein
MMPQNPKIYHIVHVSKLSAIIGDGFLVSDSEMRKRSPVGITIGMQTIKDRRITLPIRSCPGLKVGECVPFYFCPRSVMLYIFHMANHPDIEYLDGQESIIHLVADLREAVAWAKTNGLRWVFTTSNAGSRYFEDFSDLRELKRIDWETVQSDYWNDRREAKQAEFLIENKFPWELIEEIGVFSFDYHRTVVQMLKSKIDKPPVRIHRSWYY